MRLTSDTLLQRSKRFLFISATGIFLMSYFLACQKEFSFEGTGNIIVDTLPDLNDSLATYSLIPDAGSCASVVSSGISELGVPNTSSNYKIIPVHVTRVGHWSYLPTTLAGITYSGLGRFTDTGISSITLYGSGTPDKVGAFDYPLNVNNVSCSFRNIVWPAGTPPIADSSILSYYKANIGGADYFQAAAEGSGYRAGSSRNGAGDDVSLAANISPASSPYPSNSTSMVVIKGTMHNYLTAGNAQFKSFFARGTYPLSVGTNNNAYLMGDGFYFEWVDGRGHVWNTLSGTADQSYSYVKIISVTDEPDPVNYYVKVKLEFSCKLYSLDTGEMKQLGNGEFVGLFGKL